MTYTHGRHVLSFGGLAQWIQSNDSLVQDQYGQIRSPISRHFFKAK
jgi:hypothetical protein